MPAVVFDGAVVKRRSHLRYFGIHFDRMLPAVVFDGAVVKRTSHLRYFEIHFDRMLRLQKTRRNNSTEAQERSVGPDGYGCKGY